jgi:hypothetical protein
MKCGQADDTPVEKCVYSQTNTRRQIMKYRNLIVTLMMSVGIVFGQAVTGFVGTGEEPLVGANVVVEGTELGGVTDAEGKFVIETGSI